VGDRGEPRKEMSVSEKVRLYTEQALAGQSFDSLEDIATALVRKGILKIDTGSQSDQSHLDSDEDRTTSSRTVHATRVTVKLGGKDVEISVGFRILGKDKDEAVLDNIFNAMTKEKFKPNDQSGNSPAEQPATEQKIKEDVVVTARRIQNYIDRVKFSNLAKIANALGEAGIVELQERDRPAGSVLDRVGKRPQRYKISANVWIGGQNRLVEVRFRMVGKDANKPILISIRDTSTGEEYEPPLT